MFSNFTLRLTFSNQNLNTSFWTYCVHLLYSKEENVFVFVSLLLPDVVITLNHVWSLCLLHFDKYLSLFTIQAIPNKLKSSPILLFSFEIWFHTKMYAALSTNLKQQDRDAISKIYIPIYSSEPAMNIEIDIVIQSNSISFFHISTGTL